jgi:hypothetical protein
MAMQNDLYVPPTMPKVADANGRTLGKVFEAKELQWMAQC